MLFSLYVKKSYSELCNFKEDKAASFAKIIFLLKQDPRRHVSFVSGRK